MASVLAVTTSMGSRWEAYSQALLRFEVPEWQRVIVDGRSDWTPTGFIQHVIGRDADYIVHVDEDCFVQSREALLEIVELLEKDPGIAAAGIPDGGCYYREHNPAALNLFFVVFRAQALRDAWKSKDHWDDLHFRPEFSAEVVKQRPELDATRIHWDEGEPYYPLFWSLLSAGGRFLYLREELYQPRWSSRIYSPSGGLLAEHLWYLREWFSGEAMPGHDCPNCVRYSGAAAAIHQRFRGNLSFLLILWAMKLQRLLRRMIR
jgi:hypothetical protein